MSVTTINKSLPYLFLFLSLLLFASRSFEDAQSSPLGLGSINRIIGLMGAIFFSVYYISRKRTAIAISPIQKTFLAYIITCLISALLMSNWVFYSLWKVTELVAVFVVSVYITTCAKKDPRIAFDFYNACLAFFLFLIGSVLVGLLISPSVAMRPPVSEETLAAVGQVGLKYQLYGYIIQINANSLGAMAAIIAYVFFVRLGGNKDLRNTMILGLALAIMVFAQSRTAFIGFMLAMTYYLFYARSAKLKKRYVISAAAIAFVFFIPEMVAYFTRGVSQEQLENMSGRRIWWEIAFDAYKNGTMLEQFFGFGFMTANRQVLIPVLGYSVSTLHSDIIDALISTGVAGVASFFTFFIFFIKGNIRRKQPSNLELEISGIAIIIAIRSLTGTSLAVFNFFLPIALAISGLSYVALKNKRALS